MRSHTCLWFLDFAGIQEALGNNMKDGWLDGIRVPALVFDYPRHSGATDEGMTHRVLIFSLCGFKPKYKLIERIIKAHEHNQLARPRCQDLVYTTKTRRRRPSQTRIHLGFNLPHLSVINLGNNPETQPSHIKGWEGDPSSSLDTFPPPPERSNPRELTSTRSNLRHRCKHLRYNTIAIKSDKQDVGLYPPGGRIWINSCVPSSLSDRRRVHQILYSHNESKGTGQG
jgi:hypothetical protein